MTQLVDDHRQRREDDCRKNCYSLLKQVLKIHEFKKGKTSGPVISEGRRETAHRTPVKTRAVRFLLSRRGFAQTSSVYRRPWNSFGPVQSHSHLSLGVCREECRRHEIFIERN